MEPPASSKLDEAGPLPPAPSAAANRWRIFGLVVAAILATVLFGMFNSWLLIPPPENKVVPNRYKPQDLAPFMEAQAWTLFALDPMDFEHKEKWAIANGTKPPEPPKAGLFYGYEILAQREMTDPAPLRSAVHILDQAGQHWEGAVAGCFNPRHGIRLTKAGRQYEIVLCYECGSATLYADGKHTGNIMFGGRYGYDPDPALLNQHLPAGIWEEHSRKARVSEPADASGESDPWAKKPPIPAK